MHPNIALGALNFSHAAFIRELVSEDPEELKKASEAAAVALIKNVEYLGKLKEEYEKF